jgi:hypothetical protein
VQECKVEGEGEFLSKESRLRGVNDSNLSVFFFFLSSAYLNFNQA